MSRPQQRARVLLLVMTAGVCCSCGTSANGASARATLRSAATATAQARSFTLSIESADVTYEAPDRVQQIEHGEGTSASGGPREATSSSGPFPVTITKIFIGDRSYEADVAGSESPTFTVATRCANEQNAAEYVLRLLRVIGTSAEVDGSGSTVTFRIPPQTGAPLPTSGTATVSGGFVQSLNFTPGASSLSAVAIGSINTAPPVTAPTSSSPTNVSCN